MNIIKIFRLSHYDARGGFSLLPTSGCFSAPFLVSTSLFSLSLLSLLLDCLRFLCEGSFLLFLPVLLGSGSLSMACSRERLIQARWEREREREREGDTFEHRKFYIHCAYHAIPYYSNTRNFGMGLEMSLGSHG